MLCATVFFLGVELPFFLEGAFFLGDGAGPPLAEVTLFLRAGDDGGRRGLGAARRETGEDMEDGRVCDEKIQCGAEHPKCAAEDVWKPQWEPPNLVGGIEYIN